MTSQTAGAPHAARATFLILSVVAVAGLTMAAASPQLAPGAALGPAGSETQDLRAWAGLRQPDAIRPAAHVLSAEDVDRYRQILTTQAKGDYAGADAEIARLADPILVGHVLAARYLRDKKYRASYGELSDWLARHADHPGADKVYRLALARKGKAKAAPKQPVQADLGPYRADRKERVAMTRVPAAAEARPAHRLSARKQEPKAGPAAKFLFRGKAKKAFTLASADAKRAAGSNAAAHWTAGLAAWRLAKYDAATKHFEAVAAAKGGDDWSRAAGAFWAARAYLASRRPERVNPLLEQAAAYPRTFYGLLATRALGHAPEFNWRVPELDSATLEPLTSLSAGRRALALVQVGELAAAESELRILAKNANRTLTGAVLAVASRASMPQLLYRMGSRLRDRDGRPFDSALYPIPAWQPDGGYKVDRAVIFAIMRQESKFQPQAISPTGARGLMQIMPPTASFISGDRSLAAGGAGRLFSPDLNVSLGQKYVRHLLDHGQIGGDLFSMTAAYNGGIGNLMRWRKQASDDPLLFIESISFRETRAYVERVLTNVWMYRLRLGQDTPSLDALAAGEWPIYEALESPLQTAQLAQ
ncbi:MAG: transglycosylase SLT domain-containing protein [Alphaproteobacteria bacterium]|nr:transglycosylase SLT domain-containing protein [Alphaproteobacteria bacterium]